MGVYCITFRSVTLAQRGESVLKKRGIRSSLQRTPRWMEEQGCGYCLRLGEGNWSDAAQILREAGIGYRKIYRQSGTSGVEEISL